MLRCIGTVPLPHAAQRRRALWCALATLCVLVLTACESTTPKVKMPARLLYLEAGALEDQELYSEAITKFQEVIDQNPGTEVAAYAYLRLGELHAKKEDWAEAETSYRLFLSASQNSHLTSTVLARLIRVHHGNSFTGIFFPAREVDRDMEPNRQIISEFRRFYFLYPESVYLDEMRGYYRGARASLAEHERLVGSFYSRNGQYNAAVARYRYLLRAYPDYPASQEVLTQLIEAYRRNQQPGLADELERLAAGKSANASEGKGLESSSGQRSDGAPAPLVTHRQ